MLGFGFYFSAHQKTLIRWNASLSRVMAVEVVLSIAERMYNLNVYHCRICWPIISFLDQDKDNFGYVASKNKPARFFRSTPSEERNNHCPLRYSLLTCFWLLSTARAVAFFLYGAAILFVSSLCNSV